MVDVGAAFAADREAAVLVEQGKGLFDYPSSRALVLSAAARDVGGDASLLQFVVDAGVVVDQGGEPATRPVRVARVEGGPDRAVRAVPGGR